MHRCAPGCLGSRDFGPSQSSQGHQYSLKRKRKISNSWCGNLTCISEILQLQLVKLSIVTDTLHTAHYTGAGLTMTAVGSKISNGAGAISCDVVTVACLTRALLHTAQAIAARWTHCNENKHRNNMMQEVLHPRLSLSMAIQRKA